MPPIDDTVSRVFAGIDVRHLFFLNQGCFAPMQGER